METKEIYIVMKSTGVYEDSYEQPVCAFSTKEDAEAYIDDKKMWHDKIEEIAIKDVYSRTNPDEESSDYSDLYSEFKDYTYKQLFGKRDSETLEDEDWIAFDTALEDDKFINYMIGQKEIPSDVANATVIYNMSDDRDDYNAYFYLHKCEYYYDRIKE